MQPTAASRTTEPVAGRVPRRAIDGIVLLDKPRGLSSNAALQRVKRAYRAAKAGHTGSLDPLATGLLPICLGEATKLSGVLLESDKRYRVRMAIGTRTTTGDAEGEVVATSDASTLKRDALEALLPRFTGALRQRPPMYSALKHEGRRLYELAREGLEIERAERDITIHALQLLAFAPGSCELEVHCSKGTYIRTLVEDLAAAAGQSGHVAELRRTAAGPFGEPVISLEHVESLAVEDPPALDALLLPPVAGVVGWPLVQADPVRAFHLGRGEAVRFAGAPAAGRVAVVDPAGGLLGLAEIDEEGRVAPRRWLVRPAAAAIAGMP